ncbi:MAG: Asp-tRNA(Asn)/Glu-tRNA(Gln) amidotransferase subunit GatC [Microbacteriaceae bacterium]|nr:Asp-tRNA(Asn)/Glu-tRNA(Gln) amidotransferase subunit GatC [Microbacteriaceae bacterium]
MADEPTITRDTVAHLAHLSRITLTESETGALAAQLNQILGAVAKVSEVAGADVPATSHPLPLVNITRPDEVRDVLTQEQALANAPAQSDGKFQVTAILGEEQ